MTKTQRILAVVDPAAATQVAVERAAQIAGAMGWAVELLACIHEGLPARYLQAKDGVTVRRQLLAHQVGYLRELASRHPGLQIVTKAVWDKPLHEAIIRETLRVEPRLVMKDSPFQAAASRAVMTNTDWNLVRDCPAPLWLVRGEAWPAHPTVIAMVDPGHDDDRPVGLDQRIVEEAGTLAAGLSGSLHAVYCHDTAPFAAVAAGLGTAGIGTEIDPAVGDLLAAQTGRLQALAARNGIPAERVHVDHGSPNAGIPESVRRLGGNLAVMGAISRSALQRVFLGSTAERVVDQLPCDVLVVKPARFESPVTYRPQATDFMELT